MCANLTFSKAKTREHASVALSGSKERKGAWAGPAALAAARRTRCFYVASRFDAFKSDVVCEGVGLFSITHMCETL